MTPLMLTLLAALSAPAASPSPSPAPLDACALVSADEVKVILGELREPAKRETGLSKEKECHYLDHDGQNVTLSVYDAARWGMQKGIVSEMDPHDEPGLGDEAFSVKRGSSTEMYVKKGNLVLEVRGTAGMAVTRAMAEKAAKRL
jgi:hypothetical protein